MVLLEMSHRIAVVQSKLTAQTTILNTTLDITNVTLDIIRKLTIELEDLNKKAKIELKCVQNNEQSIKDLTPKIDNFKRELKEGETHCALELAKIHTSIKCTCIHLENNRCNHPHRDTPVLGCISVWCIRAHDIYSENLIKGMYNG